MLSLSAPGKASKLDEQVMILVKHRQTPNNRRKSTFVVENREKTSKHWGTSNMFEEMRVFTAKNNLH